MQSGSIEHWLELRKGLPSVAVTLGQATSQAYIGDPRMIAFIAARYKFVAKILEGRPTVAEVGCGDAFGAPIVAQSVQSLLCTDIDRETLELNATRCPAKNVKFAYHDFSQGPLSEPVSAIYLVDVIEHIYPSEEEVFVRNLCGSLTANGVAILGTPNKAAEAYASENSRHGHVNLKTGQTLRAMGAAHFGNVFMFGMNDEVVHTGFAPMAHYLWALCVGPKA